MHQGFAWTTLIDAAKLVSKDLSIGMMADYMDSLPEDEPLQMVVWRFLKQRNLRHLARQYATTEVDRALSWELIQVWLRQLGISAPELQARVEAASRQTVPLHLAQVRGLYENWDGIIHDLASEYIDGPWPELTPSPSAAIAALQVEVAVFRGLLSDPAAVRVSDRAGLCEMARDLLKIHPGHDPVILHAMLPQGDVVTLSLLLLRL